jgi:hypothetical protein
VALRGCFPLLLGRESLSKREEGSMMGLVEVRRGGKCGIM